MSVAIFQTGITVTRFICSFIKHVISKFWRSLRSFVFSELIKTTRFQVSIFVFLFLYITFGILPVETKRLSDHKKSFFVTLTNSGCRDDHRRPTESTSQFYPVAGTFLFPFLKMWDQNKKTLLLETHDRDILCRMISYVGQIISNLIRSKK